MKLFALIILLLAGCSDAVATSSVPFVPSPEFVKGLDDWKSGAPAIATPAPPVPTAPAQGTWIDGWVDSFFKTHELHVSVNPKSYGEPQRITSGLTVEPSPGLASAAHKPDTGPAGRPAVAPVRGPDGTRGPIAGRGPDSGSAPPVEDAFPDSQATFVFQYRSAKALGGNTFVRFCNENHGRSVTGWKFIFQAIVPTGHGTSKTMLNGTVGGIDSSCFCNCGPDGFYSLKNGQVLNVASAKLLPGDGGLTLVECQLSGPNGDIGEPRPPVGVDHFPAPTKMVPDALGYTGLILLSLPNKSCQPCEDFKTIAKAEKFTNFRTLELSTKEDFVRWGIEDTPVFVIQRNGLERTRLVGGFDGSLKAFRDILAIAKLATNTDEPMPKEYARAESAK